jgi:hypothetical protein
VNRRGFLGSLLGGLVTAHELDLERLLWVPGAKRIFTPAHPKILQNNIYWRYTIMAEDGPDGGWLFNVIEPESDLGHMIDVVSRIVGGYERIEATTLRRSTGYNML